jgi:hypothetical protein
VKGSSGVLGLVVWQVLRLRALPFAQDDGVGVGWRFYVGPLALWICGGPNPGLLRPNEQKRSSGPRFSLGWDMAAPLALRAVWA